MSEVHEHVCRDCDEGFPCDGFDGPNGCDLFNGSCPDCFERPAEQDYADSLAESMLDDELDAECDCSEEYGPCELHCTVWAQREGASCRTADELALCLIDDLADIWADTAGRLGACAFHEDDKAFLDRIREELDGSMEHRWLLNPDDAQALYDLAWSIESNAVGLVVTHEDGYVIAEVTGGPLAD